MAELPEKKYPAGAPLVVPAIFFLIQYSDHLVRERSFDASRDERCHRGQNRIH